MRAEDVSFSHAVELLRPHAPLTRGRAQRVGTVRAVDPARPPPPTRSTGRMLLGPRQYDPTTQRFTSPDFFPYGGSDLALGTDPLTGNRYLFAAANAVRFYGTFRGQPVIHNLNPSTGVNLLQSLAGDFISVWKLGEEQLQNVLERGSL